MHAPYTRIAERIELFDWLIDRINVSERRGGKRPETGTTLLDDCFQSSELTRALGKRLLPW